MHGKSRTSRSLTSCASSSFRPDPEQINFLLPRFRRIKLERLGSFVDLVAVYPVARPSQQFGEIAVSQTASVPEILYSGKATLLRVHRIPAQSRFLNNRILMWAARDYKA